MSGLVWSFYFAVMFVVNSAVASHYASRGQVVLAAAVMASGVLSLVWMVQA